MLLTRRLDETDFLVNVPKLKTHSFFQMSGAVKNLFGLVPGGTKYEYHFVGDYTREAFGEKLADIAALVPRGLTVMDAIMGARRYRALGDRDAEGYRAPSSFLTIPLPWTVWPRVSSGLTL